MYSEDEYLMISGLQHFAFCRRQWGLIHIEKMWSENYYTAEGAIVHERAHSLQQGSKDGILITRNMPVFSRELGISGQCDIVEFRPVTDGIQLQHQNGKYRPVPIEYKRGQEKAHDADKLQLCAQVMCLEEMLQCDISVGYLYYAQTKRRSAIEMDERLRSKVISIVVEMHNYYSKGRTPKHPKKARCSACSLTDHCLPKLAKIQAASSYNNTFLYGEEGHETTS